MHRTQIYLTDEQLAALRGRAQRSGTSVASLIRRFVDTGLKRDESDPDDILERTFGAAPGLEVPSRSEWDRGYG